MLIYFLIFFAVLVIFAVTALLKATYLVRQAEIIIIERLGNFYRILDPGIHFVVPFIDQPRSILWTFVKEDSRGKATYRYTSYVDRIDLREAIYDFPRQSVITRDNITIDISALLYYQITDPKATVYEVANLPQAVEKLVQTTMRNIIGAMDLDETLTSRDKINEKLRHVLDDATDKWGVKVNRVELQEITPPGDIQAAMEKQMRAERDRRAMILEAEGKKGAAILEAEGEYQARVTRARGEAEARQLFADAEAQAIQIVQKAVPNENPLPYLIAVNYIKALPEITKDKNGKLILVPYETSALAGSFASIKELFAQKSE
ncbi:MAG: SPFH domain-containing protein [Candidatus Babeliales bacterium]|jgi:regulator of protease activity HflC (stomatin/prohibitin superfamily)